MLSQSVGRYANSLIPVRLQVQDSGGCMHRTETRLNWHFYDGNNSAGVLIGARPKGYSQELCLPLIFAEFSSDKANGFLYVVLRPLPRGVQPIEEDVVTHVRMCLQEFRGHIPERMGSQATLRISFFRQQGEPFSHTATKLFLRVVAPLQLVLPDGKLPSPVFEHNLFERVGAEWLLPGPALSAKFYPERS